MNIENFLKRIPVQLHAQLRQEPRPRSPVPAPEAAGVKQTPILEHPKAEYKTTVSIGTFGSSDVQDEQSMVESRVGVQPALHPFTSIEQRNKTLEDELNNIDKLKQMYESKVNCSDGLGYRSRNTAFRSLEKSSEGKNKSNEKHYLKPSNTPTFVKKYSDNNSSESPRDRQLDLKRKESENRLRQFYEQANLRSEKKDAYTSTQSREEEIEVGSPHSPSPHSPSPARKPRKQPQPLSQPLESERSAELKQYTVRLEEELKDKISDLEYKTTKLTEVELQNQEYKDKLKEVMRENLRLREDAEKTRGEKQQLETLLKELLYQREKEKIMKEKALSKSNRSQLAKENRNQGSTPNKQSSGKRQRNAAYQKRSEQNQDSHNFEVNRSARLLSTMRTRDNWQESQAVNRSQLSEMEEDREEKKVKVQNILDKLKIKISRY